MSRHRESPADRQTFRTLFRGAGLSVEEFRCRERTGHAGAEEASPAHGIVFVRRGVFRYTTRGRSLFADANTLLFLNAGQEGRYAHPLAGGDDGTLLRLEPEVALAAVARRAPRDADPPGLPFVRGHALATPRAARLHFELLAALRRDTPPLSVDDLLVALIDEAVGAAYSTPPSSDAAPHQGRRRREAVEEVKRLVNRRPDAPPRLAELAAAVGFSPFHLSRSFREVTGASLRRYVQRLRAGLAADRLARGERDLSALALDLGYSDNSHFTGAFRREWGAPPSRLRAAHADESRGAITERGPVVPRKER